MTAFQERSTYVQPACVAYIYLRVSFAHYRFLMFVQLLAEFILTHSARPLSNHSFLSATFLLEHFIV